MDIDKIISEIERRKGYGQEQYVKVSDLNIRYAVRGEGEPLILIHGFSEFLETWDFNFRVLSNQYQVYAMDLPGHGLSDKPYLEYNISFFTDFIIEFMDTFGIDKTHILGHSFGGAIAINIAVNFPDKVDKLVLESCFGLSNDISLLHRLCSMPSVGGIDDGEQGSALEHRARMEFHNQDSIANEIAGMSYRFMQMAETKRVMLNIMHNWIGPGGLKPEVVMLDKLSHVRAPTMLIHCNQDKIHPVELSRKASQLIAGSRLKIFNECGHCPHIEKAREFNDTILAYLEE